ncbi:MAG: 4Fe-4S dicluster domain-containing protein [Magnetovibrionaceae bacterium]
MVRFVQKIARWAEPFDPMMSDARTDMLLTLSPFKDMKEEQFPASTPLRGILQNDTRLRLFKSGDVIVRKGDFGTSAFLVLDGRLRAVVAERNGKSIRAQNSSDPFGGGQGPRRSLFSALAQLWTNPRDPEVRFAALEQTDTETGRRGDGETTQVFLRDIPGILDRFQTEPLSEGSLFGEVGALTRAPRQASVFAETDATLLEIRFQGLRDLRRYDSGFKKDVDDLYRRNSLPARLRSLDLFSGLADDDLQTLIEATQFESYGEVEWFKGFNASKLESGHLGSGHETPIIDQGSYPDDLIIIGFGFAREVIADGPRRQTLRHLRPGDQFGLETISRAWKDNDQPSHASALRALGYADVLKIPAAVVERIVLPKLERDARLTQSAQDNKLDRGAPEQGFLEFLVGRRFVNGRKAMVIDTEKCVRCDDCVVACAAAHGNNARFVRHGPTFGNLQVTNACMHCVDAVCLLGCPTGAIRRESEAGRVVINDANCIGCATCANSCPYDNIRMVEIRDSQGHPLRDKDSLKPILKATKCDFCVDQVGGPACQRACPHGALERVDLSNMAQIASKSQALRTP